MAEIFKLIACFALSFVFSTVSMALHPETPCYPMSEEHCDKNKDVVIKTSQGSIVGSYLTGLSTTGSYSVGRFLGIPYAEPPVGDLRWKSPMPIKMKQDRLEAKEYGPACPQPKSIASFPYYQVSDLDTDENCLTLNIWSPVSRQPGIKKTSLNGREGRALFPVMISIHGGGLLTGAGHLLADGSQLASKGVVLVNFNYRLGVLGYFYHPDFSAGEKNRASGNFGTLDQIQALKWVRDNIEDFGGDPNNITIFGVSAGALSVSHLMVSPLADGLFHKAIMQSNYMPRMNKMSGSSFKQSSIEDKGLAFAKSAGAMSLQKLRDMPVHKLLEVSLSMPRRSPEPEVIVDGVVFESPLLEAFRQGKQIKIPVLAGVSSGEGLHFKYVPGWTAPIPDSEEIYEEKILSIYGDIAEDYLKIYPASDLASAITSPVRDRFYFWPTESYARGVAEAGEDVYFYYFDHALPEVEVRGFRGFHASEMPFVFNFVSQLEKYWPQLGGVSEKDIRLADKISDYWVNFAKNGSPNSNGLPQWKRFSAKHRNYMHFKDGEAIPSQELLPGVYELHEKIYQRRKNLDLNYGVQDIGLLAPDLTKDPIRVRN